MDTEEKRNQKEEGPGNIDGFINEITFKQRLVILLQHRCEELVKEKNELQSEKMNAITDGLVRLAHVNLQKVHARIAEVKETIKLIDTIK